MMLYLFCLLFVVIIENRFPIIICVCASCQISLSIIGIVENIGVEPMTSCMPCKRSSQLS